MARDESTTYLLGAGASREGGVPLAAEILPVGHRLLRDLERSKGRAPGTYLERLGPGHADSFRSVFEFIARFLDRSTPDEVAPDELPTIDTLWALVELAYEQHASFGPGGQWGDPRAVREALMDLMFHVLVGCRLNGDGEVTYGALPNPYERFVDQLRPTDGVIALNYDTLLDSALEAAERPIDYGTEVMRRDRRDDRGPCTPLLKLHGSFNWLYCPTCQRLEYFGPRNVAHLPLEGEERAACPVDESRREHLILPPSLLKSYENLHLQRIWGAAAQLLQTCTRLVVAGYAMGDADIYVRYLVKQATSINPGLRSIVVINHSREALASYRALFGSRRLEALEQSFGDYLDGCGATGR